MFTDFLNYFSSFNFKGNRVFIDEGNSSHKIVTVEEELQGIDTYGIGNLEDLLRVDCSSVNNVNLKLLFDGGELIRNISKS